MDGSIVVIQAAGLYYLNGSSHVIDSTFNDIHNS